jgi:2-polyprenyl-3-methyl-5-hydroxy-6-metoxy-1,4-benzoquinol methylase
MNSSEFRELNSRVYQSLAPTYQKRWRSFFRHQRLVLKPLIRLLTLTHGADARILDIGCGVGLDLYILNEAGFQTVGIDIAPKMTSHAKTNVPQAHIKTEDALKTKLKKHYYDAIVLDAFIHLFPKKDVTRILRKADLLLKQNGLIFISTTRSRRPSEGLETKQDYPGKPVRYRAHWTKNELLSLVCVKKLRVLSYHEDKDPKRPYTWMTLIVQKPS